MCRKIIVILSFLIIIASVVYSKNIKVFLIHKDSTFQENWAEKIIDQHTYWYVGEWGEILFQGGQCYQTREVACKTKGGQIVDDKYCESPKPETINQIDCFTLTEWKTAGWSDTQYQNGQCFKTKIVQCVKKDNGNVVDDIYCSGIKPSTTQQVACSEIIQWASYAVASSQWSSGGWSAMQATGSPNTTACGDISTAWAPRNANDGIQWIELTFPNKVYATKIEIREINKPGYVTKVQLVDESGNYHTVWQGTDPTVSCPWTFIINLNSPTSYLTNKVKIYIDTDKKNGWEELDAVSLWGILIK